MICFCEFGVLDVCVGEERGRVLRKRREEGREQRLRDIDR